MKIRFQNACPYPLKDQDIPASSVWNTQCEFNAPEYVLVEATSGRGKSTLISCLYGTRFDYEGAISFDGKDLKTLSIKQWAQLRQASVSVVFQDLRLFPELTVRENLILKQRITNTTKIEEMENMVEILGISGKLNQKAKFLSLGQQQRVAIIRSLLQPFNWLLLDEPFSHLDKVNSQKAIELIEIQCKKNNAGMFLTSLNEDKSLPYHRTIII